MTIYYIIDATTGKTIGEYDTLTGANNMADVLTLNGYDCFVTSIWRP